MRKILEKILQERKKSSSGTIYPSDLDRFLIDQGTRKGADSGKLKDFYEMAEHPGWYCFIFEGRSLSCSIDVGLALGLFVECGPNTVELHPKLQGQLNE